VETQPESQKKGRGKKIIGIIAREVGIIFCMVVISLSIIWFGLSSRNAFIAGVGGLIFLPCYIIYLIIRFIIWALRKLRES
jgi:hypothetical protein